MLLRADIAVMSICSTGTDRVVARVWRPVHDQSEVLAVLAVRLLHYAIAPDATSCCCAVQHTMLAAGLQEGSAARATACTALNEHSSRSHAILSIRLQPASSGRNPSVLHLVDLAGACYQEGHQSEC